MPEAPPELRDRKKKYEQLTKAMFLRAESYKYQANAVAYCDVRTLDEKRAEVQRLLDLEDDYRRIAGEYAHAVAEEKRILIVPAMAGLRAK